MKSLLSKTSDSCRLCGSHSIKMILDVPSSQPVDGFRPHCHKYLGLPRFKMGLYLCETCNHVQLIDVVDPEILYGSYIYTSKSSPDLLKHFNEYSKYLFENKIINNKSRVLDVGCNDGLFLNILSKFSQNLYGIDPAPNIIESATESIYKLFSGYCDKSGMKNLKKAFNINNFNLITANNVFAHADNLKEMLSVISSSLADDGYFCFEVSYVLDMVQSNVVDYIYHEHLSYHGVKSLVPFLSSENLYIKDIIRVNTKGGSIRVLCSKNELDQNKLLINKYINLEEKNGCYKTESYETLKKKLNNMSKNIKIYLQDQIKFNKIFCYGAAPTSVVNSLLLKYDQYISAYIDDNPIRHKTLAPNIFVPVLDPQIISRHEQPVIIIGAWRFSEMIIERILNLNKNAKICIPSLKDGLKFIN